MSTRLSACFQKLEENKRKALIPYIVAGDPQSEMTVNFMHELVNAGADVIELGMPFSDPMADGPSIQAAHERALTQQISCKDVLLMVAEFRKKNPHTPVVLMGYLNPIEVYGYTEFARDAAQSGVDALLIVDLPPEEAGELKQAVQENNMALIFLIAPTTTAKRIALICEQASGFLYYVSLKGVTGAGLLDLEQAGKKIAEIKQQTNLPVNVGFGIKDGQSAAMLARFADGVVVGSKLVEQCVTGSEAEILEKLSAIISDIRSALDA